MKALAPEVSADVPTETDHILDVIAQALRPLLTFPEFRHNRPQTSRAHNRAQKRAQKQPQVATWRRAPCAQAPKKSVTNLVLSDAYRLLSPMHEPEAGG